MTRLEALRRCQGLTQAELALEARCATKSIANLERRHWARPSAEFLQRLAEALGEPLDRGDDLLASVKASDLRLRTEEHNENGERPAHQLDARQNQAAETGPHGEG
jgi:transcriptional regulator with XRE-family HTH domain